MRQGAGVNHMDHRIGMPTFSVDDEGLPPGMEMSIGECEGLSFAVLLGCDLTEEFPVIWLRLRQALNRGAKIFFIGHYAPEIAKHLTETILHTPGQELETLKQQLPEIGKLGNKGAIFVGSQYLNTPNRRAILSALKTLPNISLNIMEGRGNSMGARWAGMHPAFGPQGKLLAKPGLSATQVLETASHSGWSFLYVAGANPATQYPSKLWKEVRSKIGFVVVQDLFLTETAQHADVVLPTLSFVEKGGSFINIEGRVQTLMPGKVIPDSIYSDAEIFTLLGQKLGVQMDVDVKVPEKKETGNRRQEIGEKKGEPGAKSQEPGGGLKATFARALFDNGVRMKHNPHVIQLAKEPMVRIKSKEGVKRGIKAGQTIKLSANGNKVAAKVKFDDGVAAGTIVLPLGFDQLPVHDLGIKLLNGMNIEIQ